MKPLLAFCLILSSLSIVAQEAEELWSGTATVRLSTSTNQPEGHRIQRILYRSPQAGQADGQDILESSLGTMVFKALRDHRLTGYADIELKTALSGDEIDEIFFGLDTIRFNDSHHREVPYALIARKQNPEHYYLVDIQLKVTYSSDGSIRQTPLVVSLTDGDEYNYLPPVYLPVELLDGELLVDQPGWNAINRMTFAIHFDSLKTRAKSKISLPEAMEHLTDLILITDGKEFSNVLDWGDAGSYELNKMVESGGDTVLYIDPITYESTIYPNSTPPMYEHANKLRLYQFWAWDDRAARFVISPIGYAPVRAELDENGTWLYDWPFINWAHPWYRKN